VFTPERRAKFEELATHYPPDRRKSAILYAIFMVQEQQGYVSANAMRHVADVIGCTPAEVDDVVSYYAMFYRQPVGKYVVQVCRTLSCALKGAERVTEAFGEALGIHVGETDKTGTFTLIEVECLGACDRAPVVMVNDGWHECLAPADAPALLDRIRTSGEAALSGCYHQVEK
jgi:NADH-quinone oxidoreductase E subunit